MPTPKFRKKLGKLILIQMFIFILFILLNLSNTKINFEINKDQSIGEWLMKKCCENKFIKNVLNRLDDIFI